MSKANVAPVGMTGSLDCEFESEILLLLRRYLFVCFLFLKSIFCFISGFNIKKIKCSVKKM
jgi:hypothetical protein